LYRWEEMYKGRPPWDIGRPQPVFVRLFRDGEIKQGRVLDVGCGSGENAMFLAENGCSVSGVDIAHRAIELAREKTAKRRLKVDFSVCDVLTLGSCFREGEFDTVIDSGLFHALADEERPVYVKQVYRVLKGDGAYFMMCFSDKEPGEWGPRRVSREEIVRVIEPLFRINYIKDAEFESLTREGRSKAYLVSATKIKNMVRY
jgi:ubiquinone/menaquinone biosynthesis C-methylase UbiE